MPHKLNTIYHVFNQGNNRQRIFFSEENYRFFTAKIRRHIMPVADILAYCLMPNHFHLLLVLKPEGVQRTNVKKPSAGRMNFQQAISNQFAIALRSYTQAINKQNQWSGSLFRQRTKFKPVELLPNLVDPTTHTSATLDSPTDYLLTCFDYIHANPVKADLVYSPEEWPFSSYVEFSKKKDGGVCNIQLARDLIFSTLNCSY